MPENDAMRHYFSQVEQKMIKGHPIGGILYYYARGQGGLHNKSGGPVWESLVDITDLTPPRQTKGVHILIV